MSSVPFCTISGWGMGMLGGAEGRMGVRVLGWFGKEVRVLGDGERVLD